MRCYLSKQILADCQNTNDDAGKFRFVLYDDYDEGTKPKIVMLCKDCYYLELKVQTEMFEEKYGSFCLECGTNITIEIKSYSDITPCFCYKHLYGNTRIRKLTVTLNRYWHLYDEDEKEKILNWINN